MWLVFFSLEKMEPCGHLSPSNSLTSTAFSLPQLYYPGVVNPLLGAAQQPLLDYQALAQTLAAQQQQYAAVAPQGKSVGNFRKCEPIQYLSPRQPLDWSSTATVAMAWSSYLRLLN